MQIDAHQHFWSFDAERYPWIVDGGLDALRRDFLPDHLRPLLDAHGISSTIAVQACHTEEETEWLLGLAAQYPWIVGVVGWIDLAEGDIPEKIARLRALPGGDRLVGIRHVIQDEPAGFMDAEPFRRGVRALGAADLAYDLLIFERQAEEAVRFCRALDGQRIVLDHIGKPRIKDHAVEPWGGAMDQLAALPHVSVKLSGMVTEADWRSWTLADLEPYIERVFEAFREERVMFGSDWPVCTLAADYGSVLRVAAPWTANHGHKAAEAAYGPFRHA
ncbi:MAG: L-fuconolactonase [Planctomycetota bacterium]|jgi:L-fuconolactonase